MIGRWQASHNQDGYGRHVFVRDLLRDFCLVHTTLTEQHTRFTQSGTISYAVLRELLGEALRKGIFWRLKDTAHHLFRKKNQGRRAFEGDDSSVKEYASPLQTSATCAHSTLHHGSEALLENILDWCIGYAFHECAKLKEDAFQRQHYSNRLWQLQQKNQDHAELVQDLLPFTNQTSESIAREMARILGVLEYARKVLVRYLQNQGENMPIARFLSENEELAQKTFQEHWESLISALYADTPATMYILAAKACFEGGHKQEAFAFVEKAKAYGADVSDLELPSITSTATKNVG